MFCPKCGHERVANETRFCSKCGFLLSGTLELLMTGGVIPSAASTTRRGDSPRRRGVKQGLFIFFLSFLLLPLIAIITVALNAEPYALIITSILLGVGSFLRIAYAMMFESTEGVHIPADDDGRQYLPDGADPYGLPAAGAHDLFTPPPRASNSTSDLHPGSVTEGTTRLLEQDKP
jgi:hypothetical protein